MVRFSLRDIGPAAAVIYGAVFLLLGSLAIYGWLQPRPMAKPIRWPGMERIGENSEAIRKAAEEP
jgi:hypothetical protein